MPADSSPGALANRTASGRQWVSLLLQCFLTVAPSALAGAGCERVDIVARSVDDGAGQDAAPDAALADAAAACLDLDWARPAARPDALQAALAVAEQHALCCCQRPVFAAPLVTHGGDVGLNAGADIHASSELEGALRVASINGLNLGTGVELEVDGDLAVAGPLQGAARVTVGGDAEVGGRIELTALHVAGTLRQPQGESRVVAEPPELGQPPQTAEVSVPAPCACSATAELQALVEAAQDSPLEPCDGGVQLPTEGALFVRGDLQSDQDFSVLFDADPLALVVQDNVSIRGRLQLGDRDARVDFFVGGSGNIRLQGGGEIHGTLYAPEAELVLGAPLTIHGALFVRRVAAEDGGALTIDPR